MEYVLLLPVRTEVKSENNPFGIKKCSVTLRKFDSKWQNKSKHFAVFNACKRCEFMTRREEELKKHRKECRIEWKL